MKPRRMRILAAVALGAGLVIAGILLWRSHAESVAKAALAAEIEAERAARPWPDPAEPTAEEAETADIYARAIAALAGWLDNPDQAAFSDAVEGVPWTAVPPAVARTLALHATALALADEAAGRKACRFPEPTPRRSMEVSQLLRLLAARGHAALATGDPVAAVGEVRRLVRVGRDLAAVPRRRPTVDDLCLEDIHLLSAEESAAGLLAAVATSANLSPETAPVLAAAARDGWGTREAGRRMVDFEEEYRDAVHLILLGPDGEAYLGRMFGQVQMLQDTLSKMQPGPPPGLLDRIESGVRRALRSAPALPRAGEVRAAREGAATVLAAVRRRDVAALAQGTPLDRAGQALGFESPRWFRRTLAREARIAVARTAAAVRAFAMEKGRLPRDLEELAADGFAEAIVDPYDGKPLDFGIEGDGWQVSSRVRFVGKGEEPPAEVRFPAAGGPR